MAKSVRTFVAAPLPTDIIRAADRLQQQLKQYGFRFRWVRPANIHLTIKFLGEIVFERIEAASNALHNAAGQCRPLELTAQGLGVFPNIRRPRILWIGLGGEVDMLHQIHQAVESSFENVGFPRDNRSFRAHLTLARLPRGVDVRALLLAIAETGNFITKSHRFNEIVLFSSELRPTGAVYSPLRREVLGEERESD